MERRGLRSETFAHTGCKITAQKSLFFGKFCRTSMIFFCIGGTVRIGRGILCLPSAVSFRQCLPLSIYHMSHVTIYMSCVMCQV
jgi:hypothetical protein